VSSELKRFLTLLTICAFAGWIGGNWLLGPPGLSPAYLSEHRAAHEHYIETLKNPEYKIYMERPHLVDLEAHLELQQRVAFVEQYASAPAFLEEQHRIELYTLFFEFFNAGLVVVLLLRVAKAPLYDFLGGQIDLLREKMNQAARSRKSAEARRSAAEAQLDRLPEMEMKLHAGTEQRLERELHEAAEANHYSLGLQERELAERKTAAYHTAEVALRKRLVDAAVAEVIESARNQQTPERHDQLIEEFLVQLEAER